jgi:Domain of unknown function (DUF1906)
MNCFDSPNPALCAAKAPQLAQQGITHVLLYISPRNPNGDKTVKPQHVKALHTNRIAVGFICEWWGGSNNFAHHDIDADHGKFDGDFCGHYLRDILGAPAGTAVYPTVDNDTSAQQLRDLCLPYMRAFRAALDPQYRMGAYGSGALLFALEAEQPKILDFPWLSNATGWNRTHEYAATGRAAIVQQRETKLLGIDVDPDVLNAAMSDVGFWMPPPPAQAA